MTPGHLAADLTVSGGSFAMRARFGAAAGEVVAVVGPNGAGKSTLLRGLAGLSPTEGTLRLGGRDLLGLPTARRGIGWVPQAGLLFPHLSALHNVAYAARSAGTRRAAALATARHWLERFGIADLSDRRPHELSGGQAQRVALARALAAEPGLLLLDEPFGALDSDSRQLVRRLLADALAGSPAVTLLVTHDPVDALVLAHRALVVEAGQVVQDAPVGDLAARPRSAWAARLLGLNAWTGTATATGLAVDGGGRLESAEPLPPGTAAVAVASPGSVALHREPPHSTARNVLSGAVTGTWGVGDRLRVALSSSPGVIAEVTGVAASLWKISEGDRLWATIKATEVRLVPL